MDKVWALPLSFAVIGFFVVMGLIAAAPSPQVTIRACQESCTKSGFTKITFGSSNDADVDGTRAAQACGLKSVTIKPDGTVECVCKGGPE